MQLTTCITLLKYFSVKREQRGEGSGLPDPQGPLCKTVPSASIEEANEQVKAELKEKCGKACAPYIVATPEQKAKVGKYVAENGTTNAIRIFSRELPNLKESTVRRWKKVYLCELATKKRAGDEKISVDRLPVAVKGRPLLLGKDLDHQVQAYIASLREAGGVVNMAIVIAAATGIVRRNDSNLLAAIMGATLY